MKTITTSITAGITYYHMESRGTKYSLRFHNDEWELYGKKMNYGGRFHMGNFKFFKTLEDLEDKIKSFRGISQLIH